MNSRTVYTVLDEAVQKYGSAPALHQPAGKGKYKSYSWAEYGRGALEIACGLRRIGIKKGDIVALYSETRAEFYIADIGIMASGAIAAALYTTYPLPDLIGNLRASEAKAVFVEDAKNMQALVDAAGDAALSVRWILLTGEAENAISVAQLREEGRKALVEDPGAFDKIRADVRPEDHAILYLTSGATGEPKMPRFPVRAHSRASRNPSSASLRLA